jgi:CubicO group peptidase (beta-lactamase class C family)
MMSKRIRKIMTIIAIVLAVGLLIGGVGYLTLAPRPLQPPAQVDSLQELEAYLEALAGYNPDSPTGLSLVVVKGGRVVYEKGFGFADEPKGIPARADTVYNTWSMVKPLTAAAVLQLQEAGRLDLDDPVVDHLPFFEVEYPSADSQVVTVRHLMNHSSGLKNNVPEVVGWIHFDGDPEWNQTELIQQRFPDYRKLAYEPGTQAVYTNVGYMLLAALIEQASGQAYQQYMIDSIFEPLGMDDTSWTYMESTIDREAAGSSPSLDAQALLLPLLLDKDQMTAAIRQRQDGRLWFNRVYTDQKGPTGPISSAPDMARFLMAFLNGGELDGVRILSEESINQMKNSSQVLPGNSPEAKSYRTNESTRHGLGWIVIQNQGEVFYAHSGGGPGFASAMRAYPDRGLGMVVIANGTYLPRAEILDLVASLEW